MKIINSCSSITSCKLQISVFRIDDTFPSDNGISENWSSILKWSRFSVQLFKAKTARSLIPAGQNCETASSANQIFWFLEDLTLTLNLIVYHFKLCTQLVIKIVLMLYFELFNWTIYSIGSLLHLVLLTMDWPN
jgi:hypothetical protein